MFEHYEDIILAETLREFFASVKNKKGETYSKSSMINLRAGLNHFLRLPPNNRIINLMHNEVFQNANQVFKGQLRRNKNEGKDKSKPRSDIAQQDLDKLYDDYFTPGLAAGNTEVLLHKVFFDIMYFTGRRGKEGLRNLTKNSFAIKRNPDGSDYIEVTFNETTKKNQGDTVSSAAEGLHNNHAIITEQEGDVRCPVNSFRHYLDNLNSKCDAFFQYPNKDKNAYESKPIGKNTLGTMMKTISKNAKLSKMYTNHCIRKTTATGMHCQGYSLKEIANVTKHKNLQSLENYISGPNQNDKQGYSSALFDYSKNKENSPQTRHTSIDSNIPKKKQKYTEDNIIVPFTVPTIEEEADSTPPVPLSQNVIQNQLRQAANMFQNATFNNCNISFQMPK